MKNIKQLVAVICLGAASIVNASVLTFTDRNAWIAAVNGSFNELTFDSASTPGLSITEIGSGHSSGISGGVYHDRVVRDDSFTTYTFANAVYAVGANWDLTPGGAGQGLQLFAGSEAITPQIANSYAGQFFGFVSTNAFTSFSVKAGSDGGIAETHDVDNLLFAAAVPEPETYAMLLSGLCAIGLARRRKAKAK